VWITFSGKEGELAGTQERRKKTRRVVGVSANAARVHPSRIVQIAVVRRVYRAASGKKSSQRSARNTDYRSQLAAHVQDLYIDCRPLEYFRLQNLLLITESLLEAIAYSGSSRAFRP
jgi:hypothetical protein